MTKSNYLAAENSFRTLTNLKVGDTVKVLRKCKNREHGWQNGWNETFMDDTVGKTFTVSKFSTDGYGIYLSNMYYYPFFALQVMEQKNVEIKISSSYTATIYGGSGDMKVGCQEIPFALVEKLYKASVAARKPVTPTKEKKVATKKVSAKKTTSKKVTLR